jgi:hypothetical protein
VDKRVKVEAYRQWVKDCPVQWAKQALGVQLIDCQKRIIEALAKNSFVTVRSSNAIGKSFLSAVAIPWYLNWNAPGYVIVTSSSWNSLKKTTWQEVRRIAEQARCREVVPIGGLKAAEWSWGTQWGAFSVSPVSAENFAGFRTPHGVMVVVDEASALSPEIMEAIHGLVATEGSRVLLIGNPLRTTGPFYESFRSGPWTRFAINVFDSPNVRSGQNLVPGLATRHWVRERLSDWGKDSPAFMARVMGEFPEHDENLLLELWEVEQAAADYVKRQVGQENEPLVMGCDIARYGPDDSKIMVRQGSYVFPPITLRQSSTMETAGRIIQAIELYNPESVFVDVIGIGAGVVDRLLELGYTRVVGVNVATSPDDTGYVGEFPPSKQFANLRAQLFVAVQKWVRAGGIIPPSEKLRGELSNMRYGYNSQNRFQIEDKEKIRARIGRSPDEADALALTFTPCKRKEELLW